VGIVGNQVVARYKLGVGRRIHSATLVADARHSWLDAVSSAGAMLGLVGVALGLRWADGVAGLLVTGFICHVGYEVTKDLFHHLMDGIDPDLLGSAVEAAGGVPGAGHVHVRGRWMGRTLVVEVEGFLPGLTTLQRSEELGTQVKAAVTAAVPEARAVLWSPRPVAS
jgi:divalent metal cation (Fe/Co/Zn/Cd) transporter